MSQLALWEPFRACPKCGIEKPLSSFTGHRKTVTGRRANCNECFLEARRAWNREHPEVGRAASRRYYWRNREKRREQYKQWERENPEIVRAMQRKSNLKRKFGLTPEEYDAMLAAQDGVCAICRGTNRKGDRLAVDHDHDTGRIRGLLCHNCNHALGKFADNPLLLRVAARYLERV